MNRTIHPIHPRGARQGGFMLLEVLCALLIFAIGVLGLVSMQGTAIRQSSDAQYRALAALQAQSLISQMWLSDRTVGTLATTFGASGGSSDASSSSGSGYSTWLSAVKSSGLPQVDSYPPTVVFATGSNLATITIYWKAPGDTEKHQYVALAQVQ